MGKCFFKVSACIVFADVLLTKVSHMAKLKVNVGSGYLKACIPGALHYKSRPRPSP